MNWEKKFAIGVSLSLEPYEYNELFKKYGKYIKEIYFAPVINDEQYTLHSEIAEQFKDTKFMSDRTKQICDLAKEHGIMLNIVINSSSSSNPSVVIRARDWWRKWGIIPHKITVTDNLAVAAFVYSPLSCETVSSFNNNLEFKDGEFSVDCIEFYDEVVLGGRNLRNREMIKELHKANCNVEILLNNGCSFNCLYCSTKKSEFCEDIVDENIKKNGLLFHMAQQSVYPSEIERYYNHLNISTYKISSRQFTSYIDFKRTLDIYINGNDPTNKDEFMLTCTLDRMCYHVNVHTFTDSDWKEIQQIKSKLWKE